VVEVSVPAGIGLDDFENTEVVGNRCKHGIEYARSELVEPRRVLTTTVRVRDSERMLSVRSADTVPLEKISEIMELLNGIEVASPVKCGEVIEENILGLGVDVIATWTIDEK
jgi:CxxC motif-containing protein